MLAALHALQLATRPSPTAVAAARAALAEGNFSSNSEAAKAFFAAGPRPICTGGLGTARRQARCAESSSWRAEDVKSYLQLLWHPGLPLGLPCPDLRRVGSLGDGGKQVCHTTSLQRLTQCVVISIGSNGEASFERAVHALNPACEIHIYDHTLTRRKRRRLPGFVTLYEEAFNATAAQLRRYAGRTVQLLKMDCDGCEFDAVPLWLASGVCTQQLLFELHGSEAAWTKSIWGPAGSLGGTGDAEQRLLKMNALLSRLEPEFGVFSSEPNIEWSDGSCIEYSLLLRPSRWCSSLDTAL